MAKKFDLRISLQMYDCLDYLALISMMSYCILNLTHVYNKWVEFIELIAVFLILLRAMLHLEAFKLTRFLIDMIKETIKDVMSFIVIWMLMIVSASLLDFIIIDKKERTTIFDSFKSSY